GRVAEICATAGSTIPVGSVLVVITAEGESAQPRRAEAARASAKDNGHAEGAKTQRAQSATATAEADPSRRVHAMPATRRLAELMGVDIERVVGTGAGGRITADDVRRAASSPPPPPSRTQAPPRPQAAPPAAAAPSRAPQRSAPP